MCLIFVVSHQRRKIVNVNFFPNYGIHSPRDGAKYQFIKLYEAEA